jgi:hypothetical protein
LHRYCTITAAGETPRVLVEGSIMKIDSTQFGSITIDGETYPHDVVVRLSGKVEKRKKSCRRRFSARRT